jgi:nondiscriminating glutamyl-tRNA synthetase
MALRATGRSFFEAALEVLRHDAADFRSFAKAVGTVTGYSGKALYQPLRAALTGRLDGPEMDRLWKLIPPGRVEERLKRAVDTAK